MQKFFNARATWRFQWGDGLRLTVKTLAILTIDFFIFKFNRLTLFKTNGWNFFWLKSSHVRPVNVCDLRYFLFSPFVWDGRKRNFRPHFVFKTKDFHPVCNSRWRRTYANFTFILNMVLPILGSVNISVSVFVYLKSNETLAWKTYRCFSWFFSSMPSFRWPLVEQDLRENRTSIKNAENLESSNSYPKTAIYGLRFAVNTPNVDLKLSNMVKRNR